MDVNLVLFKKTGATKRFPLPSSVTVIGRRQDCDLCVPLMVVSRRHCELSQDQGRLHVRDLGSRNGTFLNGRQVDEADVSPGDKIKIGAVTFAVQVNGTPPSDSAVLRPPEQSQAEEALGKSGELSDLGEFDTLRDHNATEIFDDMADELNNQNNDQ